MTRIVAADIGGTNARFARAEIDARGVPRLAPPRKYRVADYPSLFDCWQAYAADEAAPLPDKACIAFATAVDAETIKLTNSDWVVRPADLADDLGLAQARLVNDFEAVAHGVSRLSLAELPLLFGPDNPIPENGTVSVLGPGTGLGVAIILFEGGKPRVIATEGSHQDFAPLDAIDDAILAELRRQHGRVSTERILSGPGLTAIHSALAAMDGVAVAARTDAQLWAAALDGSDARARTALDRLCMVYGAAAGDFALAHGAHVVVLAGGLTQRMRDYLVNTSSFHARFCAKGRFEPMMRAMSVRLVTHDEIGLFGAAAAYREETA